MCAPTFQQVKAAVSGFAALSRCLESHPISRNIPWPFSGKRRFHRRKGLRILPLLLLQLR